MHENEVLLIVDIQNDFCAGGALQVPRADEIVPLVNRLAAGFAHVVLTQDWHPRNHQSFASMHPGRKPYDTIEVDYGAQILWPDHCVQATHGAEFHAKLDIPQAELILRKGFRREIELLFGLLRERSAHAHGARRLFARARSLACGPRRPRLRLLRALFRRGRAARRVSRHCHRGRLSRHRRRRFGRGDAHEPSQDWRRDRAGGLVPPPACGRKLRRQNPRRLSHADASSRSARDTSTS